MPLISLSRLDLSAVSTDQLFHYHQRALLARNRKVLRRVDTELLTRDDVQQEVKHSLHMAMVFSELDYDAAIDRIEQLKREAQEEGTSNANWDLLELRLSFHYGRSDRVTELLEHLQQEHADEPHVMQAIQQFLMQILSYGSRFQDLEPHQEQFAHAEESSGQIWTPDGSSLEGSGSSKIWTPD